MTASALCNSTVVGVPALAALPRVRHGFFTRNASPDELHGEIPVVFSAPKEGASLTAADVRAFCREHLGRHEVPRKVFFRPELPKNAAGKILKRELRLAGELERGVDPRSAQKT